MRQIYFLHLTCIGTEVFLDFLVLKEFGSVEQQRIWTNCKVRVVLQDNISPLVGATLFINFEAFEKLENSVPQSGLLLLLSARDGVFVILPIDVPYLVIFVEEASLEFAETSRMVHVGLQRSQFIIMEWVPNLPLPLELPILCSD